MHETYRLLYMYAISKVKSEKYRNSEENSSWKVPNQLANSKAQTHKM